MPDKPDKSNRKPSEKDSTSKRKAAPKAPDAQSDKIDDLELEPISSSMPSRTKKDAKKPEKPTPKKEVPRPDTSASDTSISDDDLIDDEDLDDIDLDGVTDFVAEEDEASSKGGKSGLRMFPSDDVVDPLAKRPVASEKSEPKLKKQKPEPPSRPIDRTPPKNEKSEESEDSSGASKSIDDSEEVEVDAPDEPTNIEQPDEPSTPKAIDENPAPIGEVDTSPVDSEETELAETSDQREFDSKPEPKQRESATVNESGRSKRPKLSPIELGALLILGIIFLATAIFYLPRMMPEAMLERQIVEEVELPLMTDDIEIESFTARWVETVGLSTKVRRNVKWTPEIKIKLGEKGSGALRIAFFDHDRNQRGDTIEVAYADGMFTESQSKTTSVYCTNGFTSELGLKDLRSRGDAYWTARVMTGPELKAPSSKFTKVVEVRVPFDVVSAANR